MIIYGIDPGKSGGVARIATAGGARQITVAAMPSLAEFIGMMRHAGDCHVFLEKASTHPKDGRVGAFNYGVHWGELSGVLQAFALPHTLVTPGSWCRVMHAGASGGSAKEKSREVVHRLFPSVNLLASDRSKKPHEGIIDALLIAEYGVRQFKGCADESVSVSSVS